MADVLSSGSNPSSSLAGSRSDTSPVYYEVSPRIMLGLKIITGATIIMVVLAFLFCLVQGSKNHTFYLLACNLIISTFVGLVNGYWYKKGDLAGDKYWFMCLVLMTIMLQCLASDVFVFNAVTPAAPEDSTILPPRTTPHNTTTTNHTVRPTLPVYVAQP